MDERAVGVKTCGWSVHDRGGEGGRVVTIGNKSGWGVIKKGLENSVMNALCNSREVCTVSVVIQPSSTQILRCEMSKTNV